MSFSAQQWAEHEFVVALMALGREARDGVLDELAAGQEPAALAEQWRAARGSAVLRETALQLFGREAE
jgi:hypothetical protein